MLASFRKPPLHEVALSVQFESITALTSAHIGLFWQDIRDRFPHAEDQMPLPAVAIERAGSRPHQLQLEVGQAPPHTRFWFMDADRRELVQIQRDRFIRNWRKVVEGDIYPRYDDHIRPRFKEDFDRFLTFVGNQGLGSVRPVQCEVAYFNHIRTDPDVWSSSQNIQNVFSVYEPIPLGRLPINQESLQLRQSFTIAKEGGFIGRLYLDVTPAEMEGETVIRYNLTARGHPVEPTIDGVMEFLDLGRRVIVEYFEKSTSPDMHRIWERE